MIDYIMGHHINIQLYNILLLIYRPPIQYTLSFHWNRVRSPVVGVCCTRISVMTSVELYIDTDQGNPWERLILNNFEKMSYLTYL